MNISIDIAIDLITLRNKYYHLWIGAVPLPDCGVVGYERQLMITGRQNGVVATPNRSEKIHRNMLVYCTQKHLNIAYIIQQLSTKFVNSHDLAILIWRRLLTPIVIVELDIMELLQRNAIPFLSHCFLVFVEIHISNTTSHTLLHTFVFPWDDELPSKWISRCQSSKYTSDKNRSISTNIRNVNTLRPRQNGRHFADDIFKCTFLNENARISIKISLNFFLRVQLTVSHHWFR